MSATMHSAYCTPAAPADGIAMLQAASLVLGDIPTQLPSPPTTTSTTATAATTAPTEPKSMPSPPLSLTQLLNPSTSDLAASLPAGFVLGKDGKIKKKRGRKPTPGLTDEGRRQARLLKNRRTAEISRRRKLALLNRLTEERNRAASHARDLQTANQYLVSRLAQALHMSVDALVEADAQVAFACRTSDDVDAEGDGETVVDPPQSDVSRPGSVADSDDDVCLPPGEPVGKS